MATTNHTCSVPVCDRPVKTAGLCNAHYQRQRKGQDISTPVASRSPRADKCKMDGCAKPVFCRAMCGMHYNRERSYGSVHYEPAPRVVTELPPLTCVWPGCETRTRHRAMCPEHFEQWDELWPLKRSDSPEARLRSRTFTTDGCWYWLGTLSHDYYGNFKVGDLKTKVHRAVWLIKNGEIPEGLQVDHKCHVTYCVRPDHLRLATPRQNSDNRRGANRGNRSGYRGVTWSPQMQQWQGRFMVQYQPFVVGYFDDPYEAHLAVEAERRRVQIERGLIQDAA